MARLLGILDGTDMSSERLAAICGEYDLIYAADGAAARLRQLGIWPQLAIGDFDSLTRPEGYADRIIADIDQDTTDCDKLLRFAIAEGHSSITLTNIEGDRPDHVLSTFASAARADIQVSFRFRRGLGWLIKAGEDRAIEAPREGTIVSLMPITECEGVTLTGVRWPLEGSRLSAMGLVSISNASLGEGEIRVRLERGAALLYRADESDSAAR